MRVATNKKNAKNEGSSAPRQVLSCAVRCGVVWCVEDTSEVGRYLRLARKGVEETSNLCKTRRDYLGEGDLVSTKKVNYQVQYKLSKKDSSERVGVTCRILRGVVSFLRVSHAHEGRGNFLLIVLKLVQVQVPCCKSVALFS